MHASLQPCSPRSPGAAPEGAFGDALSSCLPGCTCRQKNVQFLRPWNEMLLLNDVVVLLQAVAYLVRGHARLGSPGSSPLARCWYKREQSGMHCITE